MSEHAEVSAQDASRRHLLRAGGVAGVVAVGAIAAASPANAAPGQAVLQGRVNSAASSSTTIVSSGTRPTLVGNNTGIGAGALFQSTSGNGFAGGTSAPDRYGLSAANTAPTEGGGAAVAASGSQNTGVVANTRNANRFAIRADNLSTDLGDAGAVEANGGTGVGLVASTDAADVPAVASIGALVTLGPLVIDEPSVLVSFIEGVPVFGASSVGLPTVQFWGTADLDALGGVTVELDADVADVLDLAVAAVVVTANSGPMPDLWGTVSDGGELSITGGTAAGVVSYLVTAPRWSGGVEARRAAPDYASLVARARGARSD